MHAIRCVFAFIVVLCVSPFCVASSWLNEDPFLELLAHDQLPNDPIIEELLVHPAVQRLKQIDQSGIVRYTNGMPPFSRYAHSVGVYLLTKRYGGSRTEQIAALLHDISHTIFSHVGDLVYGDQSVHAYQDRIHQWYLENCGVGDTLQQIGLTTEEVIPDNPMFLRLEQPLPDLCADRLEYLLHTAILLDLLTVHDAKKILDSLVFENDCWIFYSLREARRLGMISLFLTQNLYSAPWDAVVYYWMAEGIKRSLALGLLTHDDVHFGTDAEILQKIRASTHSEIKQIFSRLQRPRKYFSLTVGEGDCHLSPKFRGIDPLVRVPGGAVRLSEIDPLYWQMYCHVQDLCKQGWWIVWHEP